MGNPLQQAIAAIKAGDKSTGRRLLAQVLQADPRNETVWLWLSGAVDTTRERRICLENALAINPSNSAARRGLESLIATEGMQSLDEVSSITPTKQPKPPRAEPTQEPVTASAAQRKKPSKSRRLGLIIGLGAGALAIVLVSIAAVWWTSNSGLLPIEVTMPTAADTAQVPSDTGTTPAPTSGRTPIPTWTPAPTQTPRPTNIPHPTATPRLVDEKLITYLEEFAPIANQVWSMFPGDGDLDDSEYYAETVGALYDQLEAMTVPEECNLMHTAFENVAINVTLFHQSWWGVTLYPDQAYQFAADADVYASEAMDYYYDHYLPAREELLRSNGLSSEEFGFTD